jgi:hypothetical protein
MIDRQIIVRKGPSDTGWVIVASLPPRDSFWIDHKVTRTVTCLYAIGVHDSGGLSSMRSPAMRGRPYDPGVLPQVRELKAVYKKDSRAVELQWAWSAPVNDAWFVIYRGVGKAAVSEYQSVDAVKTVFVDNGVPPKTQIRYAVRCETRSGEKSPLSKVAEVQTP